MPDAITAAIESSVASARDEGVITDAPAPDFGPEPDDAPVEDTPAPEGVVADDKPGVEKPVAVAPVETPEQKAAKTEAAELDAIKKDLLQKTPGLEKGRIRVVDHQAVLTRTRNQHEAKVTELTQKITALSNLDNDDTRESIQAMNLAEKQPDVFVKHVLLNDPRYVRIFDGLVEEAIAKRGGVPATVATTTTPAVAELELPKPDALLPDGTLGYSAETQQKVIEYHLAKERKANAAEMQKLRDELKPITTVAETQAKLDAAMARQTPILQDARTNWEGFSEHEAAIRAELAKPENRTMDLFGAYRKVVVGKFKEAGAVSETERARIKAEERAATIKEINAAPRTRSVVPGQLPAAAAGASEDAQPLEDVIRASIRAANLK